MGKQLFLSRLKIMTELVFSNFSLQIAVLAENEKKNSLYNYFYLNSIETQPKLIVLFIKIQF
jgi:hypothetical protein